MLMLSKNVIIKKCAPKLGSIFWRGKLTLKVKFWHFLTIPHYTNSQTSMVLFDYSWILKTLLILYPSLENSTTGIAIRFVKDLKTLNSNSSWKHSSCNQPTLNYTTSAPAERTLILKKWKIYTLQIWNKSGLMEKHKVLI